MKVSNFFKNSLISLSVGLMSCSAEQLEEAKDQDADTETTERTVSKDSVELSEEEKTLFEKTGENSLGFESTDYDLAVVVKKDGSLSLLDNDKDQEDKSKSKEEKSEDDAEEEISDAENVEAPGVGEVTEAEVKQCSDFFGEEVAGIKVTGNKRHVDVEPAKYIAVKMAGNQASINLLLTGVEEEDALNEELNEGAEFLLDEVPSEQASEDAEENEADIKGICIIARGNQPTANVVINGLAIEKVFFSGAGNSPKANFEIKNGAKIMALEGELKGNSGLLKVTGNGEYSCDNVSTNGNALDVQCDDSE